MPVMASAPEIIPRRYAGFLSIVVNGALLTPLSFTVLCQSADSGTL
jgi:hypothetical protein